MLDIIPIYLTYYRVNDKIIIRRQNVGQYMLWIWLAVFAVCLLIELVDAGTLVSVWFSVGAVIPFFMGFYKTNNAGYIATQIVVFGVVSALCLIFLRKIALKVLYKNGKETNTGMDRYVGKKYKIKNVINGTAYVKFNGVEYEVISTNDEQFEVNEEVVLKNFEGNKIIVEKLK